MTIITTNAHYMNRNLIYFTLNCQPEYLKLAKICLKSLTKTGYSGDVLFITNMNEVSDLEYSGNIFVMNINNNDIKNSSINKLCIYQFKDINNYDCFIYCDLDTIWLKSPEYLFSKIEKDILYIREDDYANMLMTTEYNYFGRHLMTLEEIKIIEQESEKNPIKGLNAGFFMFKHSFLNHLITIHNFILDNFHLVNDVMEQPFINLYLWKYNLYNKEILKNLITHNGLSLSKYNGYLIHFPGGVGDYSRKLENMTKFLKTNR